jgi:sugar lactone lactonase YvrE
MMTQKRKKIQRGLQMISLTIIFLVGCSGASSQETADSPATETSPEPEPTAVPTDTPEPTAVPTDTPEPTAVPTDTPEPTPTPTVRPTRTPTAVPTAIPIADVEGVMVTTLTDDLPAATGGVAVDQEGNVYVADIGPAPARQGTTVYKITPDGVVSVFAEGEGLLGASGNAFDSQGNLFQSSLSAGSISKITPDGQVSTFATAGIAGPVGIAIDGEDNLYVANCGNNTIVRVKSDGASLQIASSSLFRCPNGIALDDDGNLYVANFGDGRVLKVTPDGTVTEFATVPGGNNGHITYDGQGTFYVVSRGGHQIYTLSLSGDLALFAGTGERGHDDGPALEATFSLPNDLKISPDGRILYVNEVQPTTGRANHPSLVRMILLPSE